MIELRTAGLPPPAFAEPEMQPPAALLSSVSSGSGDLCWRLSEQA